MTKIAMTNILLSIVLAFSVPLHIVAQFDLVNECQTNQKENSTGRLFTSLTNRIRVEGVNTNSSIELVASNPINLNIVQVDKCTFNITASKSAVDTLFLYVDGMEKLRKTFLIENDLIFTYNFGYTQSNSTIHVTVSELCKLRSLEFSDLNGCAHITKSMIIDSFTMSIVEDKESNTYVDYPSDGNLFTNEMISKFKTLLPDDVFYIEKLYVKMQDGVVRKLSGCKVKIVSD